MLFAQCCNQKTLQTLKVKNIDMQNFMNEQLQFSRNFS